jgi:hypothetical protein
MGTVFSHNALSFLAARHGFTFHYFHFSAQPILALVAGLLILVRPKLLNFVVAAYLIVVGLLGLFNLPW